ncbi:MAG: hypothetical protein RL272_459 [Candidatus Parcubacteria bacterium]|jgi:hypothetical protein
MKKYWIPALFVAMLAGALVPAYIYNERPEAVIGPALRKLRDAKSVMAAVTVGTFAPEAVVRAAGADPKLILLPIVFVGEVGVNLPKDKPLSGTATFVVMGQDKDQKEVTVNVITTDDGTSYVQFENVPESKTSAKVVKELNGKWYSMRSRGLAAILAKDGEATAGQEDPSGKPAADAWARIRDEVSNGDLFGSPLPLGSQVLGAVNARRYTLPFRHDALVRLALDLKTVLRGRTLTDAERAELTRSMEGDTAELDVWIDRREKRLVQMSLDVKTAAGEGAEAKPSHLNILARFTSWDSPVEVKVPADSDPFVDLIERLKQNK